MMRAAALGLVAVLGACTLGPDDPCPGTECDSEPEDISGTFLFSQTEVSRTGGCTTPRDSFTLTFSEGFPKTVTAGPPLVVTASEVEDDEGLTIHVEMTDDLAGFAWTIVYDLEVTSGHRIEGDGAATFDACVMQLHALREAS